ncbi:uncharacterized protein LOC135935944 [Cloeon dipterum]|uniref:uncharacterized protein LOC135935944 n=1 Tax=Cloeon dipterum TaxID=197152 RepID=UPI00321FF88C
MPEGPANLGFFVSNEHPRKNADNVCVLVVHYNFENTKDESWIREGDAQDVVNLKQTFEEKRNCNFRSILSPEKGKLLQLLANQEELLKLFCCSDVPSVFVLYILSHGDIDGKIFTDHSQNDDPKDFICFTTTEIFESLKKLTGFEDCLKLINFGPCRGEQIDSIFFAKDENFKNENSCRITYSPMMKNTVVFFSTVETTKAKRDQKGTTFALLTCQVLNSLEKDESLINVLTTIQNETHKVAVKEKSGQTPEVKMFSQDRSFVFSKISTNDSSSSTIEAMSIKNKREREFYSWKSSSGENLRHRLAILLSSRINEQLKEFKIALSQNLDFETCERKLSGNPWAPINEASRIDSDIGCIFLIIFGLVSESKDTNEVCVQVDGQETAVSEILFEFIGPKNDQWIGKPKILFLVHQETGSFDSIVPQKPKMEISATNHSGWLVLVVHGKETLEKLIEIFKGEELKKKEKSLQELLASLLISESIENRDMLNSTLQYLLNFPDWPRSLVEPNFTVTNYQDFQAKFRSFDSLARESARKNQNIWILSSVAGTGKTTILREMACRIGKLNPVLKILRVALPRVLFNRDLRNKTEIEFLAKVTHNSQEDIKDSIENEKCVVILDGFDEIRPENQKKVLKVIEALEKKQVSVWVGTRPHEAKRIKNLTSKAVLVEIDPLDEEQQIDLLKLETGKSKDDCELIRKSITSKKILENPLQLSLVAKYGAEGNLYQIYDHVVRQKMEDSLIRKGLDKENEVKFQAELDNALKRLEEIASCHIRGVNLNDVARKYFKEMNCYGIATFENNKAIFIHRTFAEFLAALYFLREIEENSKSDFKASTEDCANLFFGEPFSLCRMFIDLFYSTVLNDAKTIAEHRESILLVMMLDPDRFLRFIIHNGCINTFKMIYPMISFGETIQGNFIYATKDRTLLVRAIDSSEEIATILLDTDLIERDEELVIILPYLLKAVAEANACLFFEQMREKYSRLPEMIHYRRSLIDAGVLAARKNHGQILILLLKYGVDRDFIHSMEGNALHCAIVYGAMDCVQILLQLGAKLAEDGISDSWDPLMLAVRENNLEMVKFLLEETISGLQRNKETLEINEVKSDLNAFHFAVQEGHNEIAKLLIKESPSLVNMENGSNGSPLQVSAVNGNLEMCQWLVDEVEVDVNTLRPSGEPRDWSPNDQICMDHFLILQKSDIDMKDARGKTALHCAAEHGYLERVKELIKSGANIRAVSKNELNAFHYACKIYSDHRINVIRFLHSIDSQLAKDKTKTGLTGLLILVASCDDPLDGRARFLVEEIGVDARAKDNQGRTALRIAVNKGKDCVDYLMTKDINLDVKNKRGQTCLHVAALRGDLEALQTWIELGGDLDVEDVRGLTALHIAACRGHLQFVKKLLACAAEADAKKQDVGECSSGSSLKEIERVNRCDNFGRRPMHLAASSENVDLVKFFQGNKADLSLTDFEGKNAIHYAVNNEGMLKFINEKDKDLLKQCSENGNTALHLALQFDNAIDHNIIQWIVQQVDDTVLNAINASGETPLLLACRKMFWSVAELLLTRNVDVNATDMWGKTAMHYAANSDNLFLVKRMHEKRADFALTDSEEMNSLHHAMQFFEIFSFLYEKNNDLLKQRLKNGDTFLHWAIKSRFRADKFLWLVQKCEIDLNVTNSNGDTPLLLACKSRLWKVAKILVAKGADVQVPDRNDRTALHYAVNLKNFYDIEHSHAFDLVQKLRNKGADLALTDNEGKNALHHAIQNFHMALFIHAIDNELVKQPLKNGDTTLHLAIKLHKFERNESFIIWLVEHGGIDLNATNTLNETPLILACKERDWKMNIVEILLSKDVDVTIKDHEGKSAQHYSDNICSTPLKGFIELKREASPPNVQHFPDSNHSVNKQYPYNLLEK